MNPVRLSVRGFHRWVAPTLKYLKHKKDNLLYRPPDPRKSFVEWNYEAELYAFGKRLGENFDKDMLRKALTDKRYLVHEEKRLKDVGVEPELKLDSNDELADNGHRFIENYVLRYLTEHLPNLPNSYVVKIKEYLTSEELLADISRNLGIDDILLIDADVPDSVGLSKGLKAVVSAVQDDLRAERLVRDLVVSQLCSFDLTKLTTPEKPVDELNNVFNRQGKSVEFRLIADGAVNTLLPVYHVGAYCDKQFLGRGFGESISVAKDLAACDVLWRMWGVSRRKPFYLDLEPPKTFMPQSPM